MKNTFISKSSKRFRKPKDSVTLAPPREILINRDVYVTSPIIWIGKDLCNFFEHGKLFGFSCVWLENKDLSVLIHSKCLIISYADVFGKVVKAINFACEYGVPIMWLHRHLPPEVCFWSFNAMLNGKSPKSFWRNICLLEQQ